MVSFLTHKKALIFCLMLVLVMFLFYTGVSLAGEKDASTSKEFSGVDFKDGQLKVSVDRQRFKKVMSEIAKKSEIQILIYFAAEEELTVDFDYLPLEKGLKKLLKGKNYAFCCSREDQQSARITSVMVFNRKEGVSVAMKDKDEVMTLDQQQGLDEILLEHSFGNLKKQIEVAMENVKNMDVHEEVENFKDALSQGGVESEFIEIEMISAALEKIQKDAVIKSR